MHTLLDLDLDFFVWPPFRGGPEEARLPSPEWRRVASKDDVRSFLEKQCHVSKQAPVQGCEAQQHEDAFNVWRAWIEAKRIIAPFNVVHVDAHSDLGSGWGNRSCAFIETELLAMPIGERRHPAFGPDQLNSGNYLLGVIANRWISQLTYVDPSGRIEAEPARPRSLSQIEDNLRELGNFLRAGQGPPVSDLPAWIFKSGDWRTEMIELKHSDRIRHRRSYGDDRPVHSEPPVPFKWIEDREFSL